MNRFLSFLISFGFLLAPFFCQSQVKRALLVAVGSYPTNSGCPPIASVNDLRYIRETLKKRDFADINIAELKDNKATKAAIVKALEELAKKARRNDIVVIFFGCHGQQIRDQRTIALGKDEADGYDEALLPYDAKSQYNPGANGYKGENHLRDDELGIKLTAIRNAIGQNGSLLVLLDACHSGSGTRDEDDFTIYRGEPVPFPDPDQPEDSLISLSAAADESTFIGGGSDTASNMVVISGSGPNQKNYQTIDPSVTDLNDPKRKVGSLTYAFAKAMADLPADADYQLLFDKIRAKIQSDHPMQLPMIEGKSNQKIFSGQYLAKQDKIILKQGVRDLDFRGDTVFTIDKGVLHNIAVGTTCKIYVVNSKEPFADAIIRKTGNFTSIGVASKPLRKGEAYEVKIDAVNYGSFSASLFIKTKDNKNARTLLLEKQVKNILQPYRFLSLSNDADMMIDLVPGKDGTVSMNLVDIADSIQWTKQIPRGDTLTQEDASNLVGSIKNVIRVNYLRSLSDGGDLAAKATATIYSRDNPVNEKSELILKAKEKYSIRINHNFDAVLYYTIIDILPNNKVKVLIPDGDTEPKEYQLRGTGSKEIKLKIDAVAIPGREVFKIILSKEPLDIKGILERKTVRSTDDHPMLSFEEAMNDMFKDSGDQRATRAEISNVKTEEIGILTVGFTVKKEK